MLNTYIIRCYNENNQIIQIKFIRACTKLNTEQKTKLDLDILNSFDYTITKQK